MREKKFVNVWEKVMQYHTSRYISVMGKEWERIIKRKNRGLYLMLNLNFLKSFCWFFLFLLKGNKFGDIYDLSDAMKKKEKRGFLWKPSTRYIYRRKKKEKSIYLRLWKKRNQSQGIYVKNRKEKVQSCIVRGWKKKCILKEGINELSPNRM